MDQLGIFIYREKPSLFKKEKECVVTLRGDRSLALLFPYFQEVINSQIPLDPKKDHVIDVERGEGHKFTFTIDHKKVFVTTLPMAG